MTDEVIGEGKWLSLRKMGNGYEYVTRVNSSGVVVVAAQSRDENGDKCLILVSQHRSPMGTTVVELPAGLSGDQEGMEEDFLEAAKREVLEETGYSGGEWMFECTTPTNPGAMKGKLHIFTATELEKTAEGGGDEHENITVHIIPMYEVDAWLRGVAAAGWLVDHKIYTGLYFLLFGRRHRG